MPAEAHIALGKNIPTNPDAEYFHEKIFYMKGKHVLAHALIGDLTPINSYVFDKYFRDGEPFVERGWWIETMEGDIWLEGSVTVRSLSKK